MINGNDAQENNRPIINEMNVANIIEGKKYSSTDPTNKGTIKKTGGGAFKFAESFSLFT